MKRIYFIFLLLGMYSLSAHSQDNTDDQLETDTTEEPSRFKPKAERTPPTIAIGAGTLSYFGELNNKNSINSPLISTIGFDLSFRQPVTYFLEFNVNTWGGFISANERSLERNLNFRTSLYGAGFGLNYNFANFLKETHFVEPFIGAGVEVISFNAKTDLVNENNIPYQYWSDGSIRNIAQNSPNVEDAVRIQRDYFYETDISTSDYYNLDAFESYTIAFPVTVGANLIMTERWMFRAAMTYHFTMTDMFDGIDQNSGNFEGNAQTDNLLYTSVSIAYNFTRNRSDSEDAMDNIIDIDMLEDEDGDGVIDFEDKCLGTPVGAEIDEFGCPLDGDKDGVPNYNDDELTSAPGAQVDSVGVTIPASDVDLFYNHYYDTSGTYSPIEAETYTMQVVASKVRRTGKVGQTKYSVAIGEFEGEIPADMVNDILSVPDVNTHESDGKVVVTVGSYNTKEEAEERQKQLIEDGITPTDVVSIDGEKKVTTETGVKSEFAATQWEGDSTNTDIIYRVQVGAFTQKADESKFKDLPGLIMVVSDDGYVRYFTGSYSSYREAARAKIDILTQGFNGAFVVAFRGGNRVSLNNIGNIQLDKTQSAAIQSSAPLTQEQKNNLKFKVQLGSYRKQIPTDVLETYMELGSVEQMKGKDQYIRYVAGSFSSYEEATTYKKELLDKGFAGCYVVAVYYGKMISATQARKMLNK